MRPVPPPAGRWLLAALLALLTVGVPAVAQESGGDLVIAQVYAGGQSTAAPIARDYVVLFNRGSGSASLDGWSLQYAAASGETWRVTVLGGELPAGGTSLIALAAGDAGAALPAPDVEGTSALSASSGKLALVESTVPLGCGAGAGCATAAGVRDFVGYGPDAGAFAGTGPAPSPGKTQALLRQDGGCTDTGANAADFVLGPPSPPTAARPARPCTGGAPGTATPHSSPVAGAVRIRDIQGAGHRSPFVNTDVFGVPGVVTAVGGNAFWMQDAAPDADPATAEGILVFLDARPSVVVGQAVTVDGTVVEFQPGDAGDRNLTITELQPIAVTAGATGQPLPDPVVLGPGGRVPPSQVIEDDVAGDPGVGGTFDPADDGLDFWESLEGMRVRVDDAVVVGPRLGRGEVPVLAADGAEATGRTPRGGIVVGGSAAAPDLNPERIFLGNRLLPPGGKTPAVDVGDRFPGPVIGVVDYAFGRYLVLPATLPAKVPGGLARQSASPAGPGELAVATLNVENLDPTDAAEKFAGVADSIVVRLGAPDLVVLEEIQDNNGPGTPDAAAVVDASATAARLITAIADAGGPDYQYADVPPAWGADGGEPGGNIRVGFLWRADRGLALASGTVGGTTTAVAVTAGPDGPRLSANPGRIDPANPHFADSRKPLVGAFTFNGRTLFVVGNHFTSKGGSDPLFGNRQPPQENGAAKRLGQAEAVAGFVGQVTALDPAALVIVLGDLNDYPFSPAVTTLEAAGLVDLVTTLPAGERYTYVFEGNSQAIDHLLISPALEAMLVPGGYAIVHVNAEFAEQDSDHDPQVARFVIPPA
jgi:hypothetical protein